SDAVVVISPDATIRYSSPSTRHGLGYTPEELVGRSGFDFVHPDDVGRIQARLAEVVGTPGGTVTVETLVRHKDGTWSWMECLGTNLLHEPAVRGVVVNFRDISERKQAERVLRESEERLRQLADS